jgi:peptidoglycan/LPS O-acetylase OafA/YrhL
VDSPARAIAFLAGLVAVVAGLVSVVDWLNTRVSGAVLVLIGGAAVAACLLVGNEFLHELIQRKPERYTRRHFWLYAYVLPAVTGFVVTGLGLRLGDRFFVYGAVSLGVIPISWLAYELNQARHKPCRDCCERIKADARICPHCGHEFWSQPG